MSFDAKSILKPFVAEFVAFAEEAKPAIEARVLADVNKYEPVLLATLETSVLALVSKAFPGAGILSSLVAPELNAAAKAYASKLLSASDSASKTAVDAIIAEAEILVESLIK